MLREKYVRNIKGRSRNAEVDQSKTKVIDIVQRIKSLKWQWVAHKASGKTTGGRILIEWYLRSIKRPKKRSENRWN